MEFHINKDPFLKALTRIQTVVERRNTMPILGNALLETGDGILTVSATDLEVSLRTVCEAEIGDKGSLAVSAKTLFEIVRELPDGSVHIRQETNNRLRLTSGQAKFTISGFPGSAFPEIPEATGDKRYTFERDILLSMFNKTHFAMSYDDTRFTLNGIFFQLTAVQESGEPSKARMVATDTHRLAMVEQTLEDGAVTEPVEIIIPKKAVFEIKKLLEEEDKEVEMVVGDTHIQFIKPDITLISKLVQGQFPDYRRVIPTKNNLGLTMNRAQLDEVVKRMSVLSHEKSRGIRMAISKESMLLSSNNPEQEAGEEPIEVEFEGDKPITVGFNARYLREILTAMEGERVRFMLHNDEAPSLVFDPDKENALFVLMPMRV
ncbi:MAG: DNA polymerase III subunit beta [Magnetococcales bacterium]|nr:DNA polymerase III subunit beta [Magnetococcales bacterium]